MRLCCHAFIIYPELTIQGNIHYHGILHVSDKVKWHKKVLPTFKYHGFVCIKRHNNIIWDEYIEKDDEAMSVILNIELPLNKEHKLIKRRHVPHFEEAGKSLDYYFHATVPSDVGGAPTRDKAGSPKEQSDVGEGLRESDEAIAFSHLK